MSSSQPFLPSSPLSLTQGRRRKSQFTYKHLAQLSSSSTACPLRVVAHIDLDAFYAQCEMVRLGAAEDQPLAVQQWQGLIAINYPARTYGLNRHITITEAKKLCPNLICQHVATWKEGEEKWAYHSDAAAHIGTHKVSLDPYRLESRRILACMKEKLPDKLQRVEKAGIDEVFLDLSAHIHSLLLERYPELGLPAPYDDITESLPLPPTTALDWQADALVDLDSEQTEEDDPDWDDIALLIGSEIVRSVRRVIREELKYTCSAGIGHNKMLSKLGSAYRKPNQQTVIRNRAVQQFLSGFKFTKIRNLGGKLGDQIVALFGTDTVKEVLPISLETMKQKLGDDTGSWVYQTIRGIDTSEVNSRTQIKSMLSAKSFRPSINTWEQAVRWLRIFVSDIYSRLVEEGVLENKRRPKTINLHHRQGGQTRSRQGPIPQGKVINEISLYELATTLLGQIIQEGRVWPCANLSLSVGGFEDGIMGNMGIGSYLVKGEEAKSMRSITIPVESEAAERPDKKARLDHDRNPIQRFFKIDRVEEHDEEFGADQAVNEITRRSNTQSEQHYDGTNKGDDVKGWQEHADGVEDSSTGRTGMQQTSIRTYVCSSCSQVFPSAAALQAHDDWHLAKSLQDEEGLRPARSLSLPPRPRSITEQRRGNGGRRRGRGGSGRGEKGQRKLTFR